jgi:hypothetical protein
MISPAGPQHSAGPVLSRLTNSHTKAEAGASGEQEGRRTGCVRSAVPSLYALFAAARVLSFFPFLVLPTCGPVWCAPVRFLLSCAVAPAWRRGMRAQGHAGRKQEVGRPLRRLTGDTHTQHSALKRNKRKQSLRDFLPSPIFLNFENSWRLISINAPC